MKMPLLQRLSGVFHTRTSKEEDRKFSQMRPGQLDLPLQRDPQSYASSKTQPQWNSHGPILVGSRLISSTASEGVVDAQLHSQLCQMPAELFDHILGYVSDLDSICLFLACKSLYSYGCRRFLLESSYSSDSAFARELLLNRLSRGDTIWQACLSCSKMHKLVPTDHDQNTSFKDKGPYANCDKERAAAILCRRHQQSITIWQKHLLIKGRDYQGIPRLPISVLEHDCHQCDPAESSEELDQDDHLSVKCSGAVQRGFLLIKLEHCAQIQAHKTSAERYNALMHVFERIRLCNPLRAMLLSLSICQIDHLDPCSDMAHHYEYDICNSTSYGCSKLQRCHCCRTELQIAGVELKGDRYVIQMIIFQNVQVEPGCSMRYAPRYPSNDHFIWESFTRGTSSFGRTTERQQERLPFHATLKDLLTGHESPRFQSDVYIVKGTGC